MHYQIFEGLNTHHLYFPSEQVLNTETSCSPGTTSVGLNILCLAFTLHNLALILQQFSPDLPTVRKLSLEITGSFTWMITMCDFLRTWSETCVAEAQEKVTFLDLSATPAVMQCKINFMSVGFEVLKYVGSISLKKNIRSCDCYNKLPLNLMSQN